MFAKISNFGREIVIDFRKSNFLFENNSSVFGENYGFTKNMI